MTPEPGADVCCVCGKVLLPGTGRFQIDVSQFCVECYDAGHRPPLPAPPRGDEPST
ncbi:MAG: hypothetical protein KGJ84_14800 [Elusimicrobia bacterium]|nr:hypothetical protein [Elusimicrobiota bacterium]